MPRSIAAGAGDCRSRLCRFARTPLLALLVLLASQTDALAQRSSGIQMTPDSSRYLINKDVGAERWSISFNLEDRSVTGNVFKTDGSPPSFIWCTITDEDPSTDPAQTRYTLDCYGSDACVTSPCTDSQWSLIASGVTLDGSFVLPPGTVSTLSGSVQPILDRSCAFSLSCHAAGGAGQLDLERGLSRPSTFRVLARQAVDPNIFYIDPFRLDSSYLVSKIMGTGLGSRMPLGGPSLPPQDIDAITRWVLEGAADN